MLARNHTVQAARQRHNAVNGFVRDLQHRVIVRINGQIGMHIAVTCVHVQRHKHTATQDFFVGCNTSF